MMMQKARPMGVQGQNHWHVKALFISVDSWQVCVNPLQLSLFICLMINSTSSKLERVVNILSSDSICTLHSICGESSQIDTRRPWLQLESCKFTELHPICTLNLTLKHTYIETCLKRKRKSKVIGCLRIIVYKSMVKLEEYSIYVSNIIVW